MPYTDSLATIALEKSREIKYPRGIARSYFILGYTAHLRNENIEAIHMLERSEKIYTLLHDSLALIEVKNYLGLSLAYESEYIEGARKINESISLSRHYDKKELFSGLYLSMARLYKSSSDYYQALNYLDSSDLFTDHSNRKNIKWIITQHRGSLLSIQGKYREASEYFHQALLEIETIEDLTSIYRLYYYMSQTYLFLKDYKKSLDYIQLALSTIQRMNNINLVNYFEGVAHLRMGEIFNALELPDSAFYYLQLSEGNIEVNNDLHAVGIVAYHLAEAHYLKNDFQTALDEFERSYKINLETKQNEWQSRSLLGMAKSQLKLGKTTKAKKNLLSIYEMDSTFLIAEVRASTLNLLSQIYYKERNYKKAYLFHLEYEQIKSNLFNEINIRQTTQLDLEYGFQIREKEIHFKQEQERTMLNTEIQRNKIIRNVVSAGLVIVLLMVGILFRNYRQKKKSDEEKELLLKEIHHRVKNNLQVISSMLNLQSMYKKDKKIREAIGESQGRVKSMALIHQMLYQNEDLTSIDMESYITKLANAISDSYVYLDKTIKLYASVTKENISIDKAIPIGLIINELLTNAYKYAFKDIEKGDIAVSLEKADQFKYILSVKDNGCGMDLENFDGRKNSMGMNLVKILVRQIKGKMFMNNRGGTEFIIEFAV